MKTEDWLSEENKSIRTRREKCLIKNVEDGRRWGLALSGGGIRSSTFCLGMVKSLAKNGLLTRFDYLSTVSGGGYAGSALGRLFQSVDDPAAVQTELANEGSLFWWWLRKNGRYLMPAGVKDTLFATSTLLRGLTAIYFDLFLLGILVACLMVIPHLSGMAHIGEIYGWLSWSPSVWWIAAAIMPMFALTCTWAYWFSAPPQPLHVQPISIVFGVLGFLVSVMLVWPTLAHQLSMPLQIETLACNAQSIGRNLALQELANITCLSGTARLVLLQLSLSIPMAVLLSMYAGRGGLVKSDLAVARNRLTRALTLCLNLTLAIVAAAVIDMASWWIAGKISAGWSAFAAGGSGLLALIVGGRALLKWLKDSSVTGGNFNIARIANVAGLLLAFLFLLFCATVVQMVVFYGGGFKDETLRVGEPELWAAQAYSRWILLALPCLLYVLLTGKNLSSLNASSLHNFYRARLTRSYVSVGNEKRGFTPNALAPASPDKVEGLSRVSDVVGDDDIPLSEYEPHRYGGPVHLINVCVNQTVDDRTGEFNRDRKGRNMSVSSIGCDLGSPAQTMSLTYRDKGDPSLGQWIAISGAAAAPGMGSHTSKGLASLLTLCGVRLGYWLDIVEKNKTALLESSAIRRFLPKYAHLTDEIFATFPGSDDPHWYVSDGGHFENTGVYALLKRETDFIVAADCGADPGYAFDDLNNLVRLARIDFNARITFLQINPAVKEGLVLQINPVLKEEPPVRLNAFGTLAEIASPKSGSFLVMARVDYASGKVGYMVILKPAMIHTLPLDLIRYKSINPTFPQQTTADQFFDERQWESYFRLGEELASAITPAMLADLHALSGHFIGHLGTGLAALDVEVVESSPREAPKSTSEVVKSSLGIGAVAGLLFSLWQVWDQARSEEAAVNRQHVEAIAKAIEKSVGSDGQLRISEGGVLFLESVIQPETQRPGVNYPLAEKLIRRLLAKCDQQAEDKKLPESACNDISALARNVSYKSGGTLLAYWPGSAIDSAQMARVAVAAAAGDAKKSVSEQPGKGSAIVVEESVKAVAPSMAANERFRNVPKAIEGGTKVVAPADVAAATVVVKPTVKDDLVTAATKAACGRTDGGQVRLYTQVYTDQDFDTLKGARDQKPFDSLQNFIKFAAVENVTATAEKSGTRIPYRWSAPTLIYHNDSERECAEKLAALYADYIGPVPNIRPLPERLTKQSGTIELWVPPGGAPKLAPERQEK